MGIKINTNYEEFPFARKVSITEARNKLHKMIKAIQPDAPIEITRRGETVAVLLSNHDYRQLRTKQPGFAHAIKAFRQDHTVSDLDIDPGTFDVRSKDPGRPDLIF